MIPLAKRIVRALLWDELSAIRWIRGGLVAISVGGATFASELAEIVDAPGIVRAIKIAALVCGFAAGSVTAGERNK